MIPRIKLLEQEVARVQKEMSTVESDRGASEARAAELSASVAFLRSELESNRAQHDAYKVKAKKVLAEKDKIIAALRSIREGGGGEGANEGSSSQELVQAL